LCLSWYEPWLECWPRQHLLPKIHLIWQSKQVYWQEHWLEKKFFGKKICYRVNGAKIKIIMKVHHDRVVWLYNLPFPPGRCFLLSMNVLLMRKLCWKGCSTSLDCFIKFSQKGIFWWKIFLSAFDKQIH